MQTFLFDLVPYAGVEDLERFKVGGSLPKLTRSFVDPQIVASTYREHLEAWELMDELGFDGVGMNEHHATPYGLMNSPNMLVSAATRRTSKLKLLVYGNLLPLHNPLRLAEELSMLDCLSNGRLIAGAARGAPREYRIHQVPLEESRERFEECYEILVKAWTEESFSHEGKFFTYKDVAMWPRPIQQPHPPVWVPVTGSAETVEWAATHEIPITAGVIPGPGRTEIIRHYARTLAKLGKTAAPRHFNIMLDCYVADSKAKAIEEYEKYFTRFFNTLLPYDGTGNTATSKGVPNPFSGGKTFGEIVDTLPIGTPDEVTERIIAQANDAGAGTVLLMCNRGALPHDMFLNQIQRIGTEVLPRLKAHQVSRVPHAEEVYS